MSIKLFVAALFMAVLVGCSSPVSGVVIDKEYVPAYTYVTNVPIYTTQCDAKGYCTSTIAYWVPQQNYVPDTWHIRVHEDDGDTPWALVSKAEYESYEVGNWFSNEKVDE